MKQVLEAMMTGKKEITFAVLFIVLFGWTINNNEENNAKNEEREEQYRGTINSLTETLKDVGEMKIILDEINRKVNGGY